MSSQDNHFPSGWHVTCTQNHWANEVTTLQSINKILLPYANQKRKDLNLAANHSCLVIFDKFKAQCTSTVLEVLANSNILISLLLANCTDRLQPLDISMNQSVKEFLRDQFHKWYASQVSSQIQKGEGSRFVNLSLTVVKPLDATWMTRLYDYLMQHPEITKMRFRKQDYCR